MVNYKQVGQVGLILTALAPTVTVLVTSVHIPQWREARNA